MAKASSTPFQAKLPGVTYPPVGTPFAIYEKGSDAVYDAVRIGSPVQLTLDNGQVVDGEVQALQAGPLIDLIAGTGSMSAMMVGRVYSPLRLVQTLTDAATETVLDVTKLYTAITVLVPNQITPLTPTPTA